MVYQSGTMQMTRTCLALATSSEVETVGFLKTKITFPNASYSTINLLTGEVAFTSNTHKSNTYNPKNFVKNKWLSYVTMLAYFTDLDDNILYRKPTVHAMVACLAPYHRTLLLAAMERDAEQQGIDLTEAKINVHHIDCNAQNNSLYNLLPVTQQEHVKIHSALKHGKSTYEALVYGLGIELVNNIFGIEYYNEGDSSVYTASIHGVSYAKRMLSQISSANLDSETNSLRVKLLSGKYVYINIEGLNIYEILSALYTARAIDIIPCTNQKLCYA